MDIVMPIMLETMAHTTDDHMILLQSWIKRHFMVQQETTCYGIIQY
jgi:hypothetical protein